MNWEETSMMAGARRSQAGLGETTLLFGAALSGSVHWPVRRRKPFDRCRT